MGCMKRVVSMLFAFILMFSMLLCTPITASAESLYIRKIVSVVYDDSGSMDGDKWAYANYAMQSFCGMLNSEDQLFITYMSHTKQNPKYTPEKIDLSANGIQVSVDSIRNHTNTSSTPYAAVEKAYEKLESVKDSNPNTQYWLVVITDGDFDEHQSINNDRKKETLNKNFEKYVKSTMPNGTNPQITFLGIGGVVAPDENRSEGIYTYSASDAGGIIRAMSEMADRISGRTRLQKNAIKKLDDKTIQVSSSIPLLNIAVFAQGSSAKVTKAVYSNEANIPISRKANLSYPQYSDLVGGAFLLGDSQNVIGSGTYNITFDQNVDLNDIIILFEPALEMRMNISLNGEEISDYRELDNAMEGDNVSVSCKIYEMGSDREISPSLMPPGTRFEITVSEDGKIVDQVSGEEMLLADYILKNVETEITASVIIEGFNPVAYSQRFTPVKYVPAVVYTIVPSFSNDTKSVKLDDIANNKDLSVCFTVYADGEVITDSNEIRKLNPVISVSPQGNDGVITYSNDGKIVFTPNTASKPNADVGSFDVEVKCTIDDGTSATGVYTVLIAAYQVIPLDTNNVVKKTELFNNQVSVSFGIMKDGVKLGKEDVEDHISVTLNEEYASLKSDVSVSPDGTITITPYSEEEHVLTFWNWWTNWAYYFGLEGQDITVTLNHALGSSDGVIDVVGEDAMYMIFNVYLPLILEILFLAAIIAYVVRYFTKARFAPNAALYVGSISLKRKPSVAHRLTLRKESLVQYNKFKYLWNPFKELTVEIDGVSITALKGSKIICNSDFPWYSDAVKSEDRAIRINSPSDIVDHCQEKDELVIQEIKLVRVMEDQDRKIPMDDSIYYFVNANYNEIRYGNQRKNVIDSATAFCYTTE